MNIREIAKDWMPPALVRAIRHSRERGIRFEGNFPTWELASASCTGYDADQILAKVLDATLKVKHGEAVFERDSVLFDRLEFAWPIATAIMWAAARSKGRLNVLDFGGALGSSYFQHLKIIQELSSVQWNVVEQSHYVDVGREYIQDETLKFYHSIEECLTENQPNVILLSSVLQYLQFPKEIIRLLDIESVSCMVIDRTPFSDASADQLVIQKVPKSIYEASYPMWIFSRAIFDRELAENWNIIVSDLSKEGQVQTSKGVRFSFQTILLDRKHAKFS